MGSRVTSKSIRADDNWILRVEVELPIQERSWGIIDFPGVEVYSVSAGCITDNRIVFVKERNIRIFMTHPYETESILCIISLFKDGQISYESVQVPVEFHVELAAQVSEPCQNTKINIFVDRDIHLQVQNPTNSCICFGEHSEYLLASDFVTHINRQQSIIIPIEVFWLKSQLYKGTELGIFELSRENRHLKNVFSKRLISNTLKVSEFPKIQPVNLLFCSPTGEYSNLGKDNG